MLIMGNTPPTAGRGSEESCDERDIRYRGHHSEPSPAQFTTISEPELQLAEGNEPAEPTEVTNRKLRFPSETPRLPASYRITHE